MHINTKRRKWKCFGFIDQTGRIIVPPEFDDVGNFSDGLAQVRQANKWGYVDKTGKMVIPAQFDWGGKFSEGLAVVELGKKWGFIDKTGKIVIPAQFEEAWGFSEGLAPVQQEKKWGFIDHMGKMVIEPQFSIWPPGPYTEGLAVASVDGDLHGYIDKTGKMVIPPKYQVALRFSEGLAAVRLGEEGSNTWGFIDKTGKPVIQPQFYLPIDHPMFAEDLGVFSGGLAEVWQDPTTAGYERAGYIDHTEKFVWLVEKEPRSGETPPQK